MFFSKNYYLFLRGKNMAKPYYILNTGKTSSSLTFGEPYILITCGSAFEFNPNKIKNILSNGISYSINFSEESVAEIHYNWPPFLSEREKSIRNIPSRLHLKEFIYLIK